MKKPVVLRIYKGEQLLGVKQFLESQIVIGRQGEVQVALEGENVAIIHAVIEEREGGAHYICDLGSETGTFRNGEMVLDTQINSGDALQIGDYKLEFYVGVPKPKAPPPGTGAPTPQAEPAAPSVAAPVAPPVVPSAPAPAATVTTAQAAAPAPTPTPVAPPKVEPVAAAPTPAPTPAPVPTFTKAKVEESTPPFEPVAVPKESPAAQAKAKTAPSEEPKAPPVVEKKEQVSRPAPTPPSRPEPASMSAAPSAAVVGGGTAGGFSLAGPKAKASGVHKHGDKKHGRWGRTFAPPSKHGDIRDYVRPSKGTVVEVLVAWRERVISTHHFTEKRTITMGSHPDNDIVLPMFASRARKVPILKINTQAIVLISPDMSGELIRGQSSSTFLELVRQNRMGKDGAAYALNLEQGEMIRIELNEQISVIVRYVSESPKPMVAPLLDLTTSEFTGVVLSFVLVAVLGLYMFLYTPPKTLPDDGLENEPLRTAMIITAKPTPAPLPPPPPPKPEAPAPTPVATPPPQIVKATPQPKKTEEKKVTQPKAVTNLTKKNDPGLSANAAPNKNKTGPRELTSPKSGGSIKTGEKEGSQMKSAQKDPSKSGIFSTFGPGANDQISQSTSGAGELAGLADQATGKAGSSENRAGQGLGSKLKDTGVGGTGNALTGIAGGISTAGRGSGNSGYGTGGLGNRAGVKIVTGGEEESFSGTIDREAIRRVIQANLRVIKTCYERQLNRNPDLFGKVVIAWEIGEQGRVVSARIGRDELGNRAVGDCIVEKLKGWRFPEPPSNQQVEVAYPFFFSN